MYGCVYDDGYGVMLYVIIVLRVTFIVGLVFFVVGFLLCQFGICCWMIYLLLDVVDIFDRCIVYSGWVVLFT